MKNCMYIYIHNYNQLMYIYIYDCWCCKHLYPMTLLVNCPICREGQIQRPTLKNNNCGRPIFAAERLRRLQPYVQSTPQCLHLKSPHGRQFWKHLAKNIGGAGDSIDLPSGNLTVCHGESPFLIGKPSINGPSIPWLC